jgi:competence protein ComGC
MRGGTRAALSTRGYKKHRLLTAAFTSVEPVVVIAIIAILAALLLPALAPGREKFRPIGCRNLPQYVEPGQQVRLAILAR